MKLNLNKKLLLYILYYSGLDSSSSFDTIQLLQMLARQGRTIVCTIHQPSSNIYNLFNQIYVMSNGYCTYQGSPQRTVEYLQSVGLECPAYHNPADFCKFIKYAKKKVQY